MNIREIMEKTKERKINLNIKGKAIPVTGCECP
jgi:hypothetical protein